MSKVNVYIPTPLHTKIKQLHIPVSEVCQRALWQEIDRLNGPERNCTKEGCKKSAAWLIEAPGYDPEYACTTHLPVYLVSNGQTLIRGLAAS